MGSKNHCLVVFVRVYSEQSEEPLTAALVYACRSLIHHNHTREAKKGNDEISLFPLIDRQITNFDLLIAFKPEISGEDSDENADALVS